jgi:hypothetical protein
LGVVLFSIVVIFTIYRAQGELKTVKGAKSPYIKIKNELIRKYPDEKFKIYEYKFPSANLISPVLFYLDTENKLSEDGIKLGITYATSSAKTKKIKGVLDASPGQPEVYLLNGNSDTELMKLGWEESGPKHFFDITQDWYK